MDKLPFSLYDFFAYLAAGSILLACADLVGQFGWLNEKDLKPPATVMLIVAAYILGQVVANLSATIYESLILRRILRPPLANLLAEKPMKGWRSVIFPGYYRRLPSKTIEEISAQLSDNDKALHGDALFLYAYVRVTKLIEGSQERLDAFRNQYGFSRNTSFALAISSLILLGAHFLGKSPRPSLSFSIGAATLSAALFYRYLKFYRQYSYELMIRFSDFQSRAEVKNV